MASRHGDPSDLTREVVRSLEPAELACVSIPCSRIYRVVNSTNGQSPLFCMPLKFKFVMFAALLALQGFSASAREIAVLRNGYTILHERREVLGEMTRLYL